MTKDNNTGKNKEFYERGKKLFDRIPQFAQPVQPKLNEAAIRADEREACAKLCEDMGIEDYGTLAIAAAIRLRGQA
jgi:hypothetical protein